MHSPISKWLDILHTRGKVSIMRFGRVKFSEALFALWAREPPRTLCLFFRIAMG